MRGKLPRYFLLSFLSFCFFSVVFQAIAYGQELNGQSTVQSPLAANSAQAVVPTPTIYTQPPSAPKQTVREEITIPSPTPTIFIAPPQPTKMPASPTPTTSPSPTPTSVPTITPTQATTPTPTPQPTVQDTTDNLDALFSQYSSMYSVSADELKKIAQCESGFNPSSNNSGLYLGMFQFSASTWESERAAMGVDPNPDLRTDPGESIRTAAFMISRGGINAWPNCH
jgi:transglycosylase-like protein